VDLLGEVLTADRMEARLRSYRNRLEVGEQGDLDALADLAHRQRTAAAGRVGTAVASEEHGLAIGAVFGVVQDPPLISPDRSGAEALLPLLAAQWSALARTVADLGDPSDDAVPVVDLHTIRSKARQCRYAADMAVPVLARARGLAKAVKDVQDILGEVQRSSSAIEWLRTTALAGSARQALVAGRVISMETSRAAQARRRWEQVWNRTSDQRRTKWLAPSS
jgi:CHAD domain-containing protein